MSGPTAALLPDGRLHLQHGPIDIVISADGAREAVGDAFEAAAGRFASVLNELVEELPRLRRPLDANTDVKGLVASRMVRAVSPHAAETFITPMAAVAGAVADEILDTMTAAAPLTRCFVNNGGDIAVHLSGGQRAHARLAHADDTDLGRVTLVAGDGIGGIATSGQEGRSLSMGIAESVTVLADDAAHADAAATLVANAVDLPGHPAIARAPANTLDPDSDLGNKLVTVDCGALADRDKEQAVASGVRVARRMMDARLIRGVAIFLQGHARSVGGGHRVVKESRDG